MMNQQSLEAAIRLTLLDSLPSGWGLPVVLGNQPTGQGRVDGIYFFCIGQTRPGWQARAYEDKGDSLELTESQWDAHQYQFNALVKDTGSDDQMLAIDAISVARMTIASIAMADGLALQDIGIQRPSEVLTPTFENEQGQYEQVPSFTVTFSHRRDLKSDVPFIKQSVVFKGFIRV